MNKYVLTIILLLMTIVAFGQQGQQKKSPVNLISSEKSHGFRKDGKNIITVYKGVFQQDYSRLTSDSAYFYPAENSFDAFGHVVINQGDTLNVYSDKLNYNGNTKVALLTDHVRLVDKDATLTTNYLTYNTATREGTYTGGGKLVNKDNTLTSKNGYYYAFTHDSYFRYDVNLLTKDALVKTDTLRYNTGTRISYFYGPTNIYGTSGKPGSRDTLYTENGSYNTVTEQAFFGKHNLYHQGTKSLKGDSLFYDRAKGYGRAVKHITFSDTEQKMTLKGDLGTYYKADERTQVTQNAYAIILTEEKDTTNADSAKVPGKIAGAKDNTAKQAAKLGLHTGPDTVASKNNVSQATLKRLGLDKDKKVQTVKTDSVKTAAITKPSTPPAQKKAPLNKPVNVPTVKTDTINGKAALKTTATTSAGAKNKPAANAAAKNKKPAIVSKPLTITDTAKKGPKMKVDSIFMSADTLETRMLTYKEQKDLQEQMRLAGIRDTSIKVKKAPKKPTVTTKPSKFLVAVSPKMVMDTIDYKPLFFGKPKPVVVAKKPRRPLTDAEKKRLAADSIRKSHFIDSVNLKRKIVLDDTTRVRILYAYHHAKLFKSDLQAKSDSIFYSTSDSTIQCFVNPIIWTQGSQLSGDTVLLQMKNKKLDNLLMFPAAFIVNVEKKDSTHYNQVSGKKMRGFFKEDKLDRMFVDGNAEDIYFAHDSLGKVTDLIRSLSSRIRVNFKGSEAQNVTYITKTEHRYIPIDKVKEEDKLLKGFIWKPKERPASKEEIIHPKARTSKTTSAEKKPPAGKPQPNSKETTGKQPPAKQVSDKQTPITLTPVNAPPDTLGKKTPAVKRDSTPPRPLMNRTDSAGRKRVPQIKWDTTKSPTHGTIQTQ